MITEDPRFAGIGRLYGTEALARLACSHVVVVGIGGDGEYFWVTTKVVWKFSKSMGIVLWTRPRLGL